MTVLPIRLMLPSYTFMDAPVWLGPEKNVTWAVAAMKNINERKNKASDLRMAFCLMVIKMSGRGREKSVKIVRKA